MKKLIIYPALVLLLGACNNNAEKQEEINDAQSAAIDTLNSLQERARIEDSLEGTGSMTLSAPQEPEPKAGTPPRKKRSNTENEETAGRPSEDNKQTESTPGQTTAPENTGGAEDNTGVAGTGEDEQGTGETGEKKKKGVNNTVKGAIIGAGAGAVGGAIINKKNPGKGAIIGGVVGAGAGAVTGVILDKNKKKKEARDTTGAKTTTKEPDTKKTGGNENP